MEKKRRDKRGRVLWPGESQRADGRYEFRFTDSFGNRKSVYSWRLVNTDTMPPGKKDAGPLRELERHAQLDNDYGVNTDLGAKTLNETFDLYMERKLNLRDTTFYNYNKAYDKHFRDTLGRLKMNQIKRNVYMNFCRKLLKGGLSFCTVSDISRIVSPVFKNAVRNGAIRTDPMDGVLSELKSEVGYESPRVHALDVETQRKFLKHIKESKRFSKWYLLFFTMLATGLRAGEVCGLRWEDCDFTNNRIVVDHQLLYTRSRGEVEFTRRHGPPKTRDGNRIIPILPELRELMIEERMKRSVKPDGSIDISLCNGYIFTTRNGTPPVANYLSHIINEICEEMRQANGGEELPKITPHILRHTFCTRLCENESDLKVIQSVMGHADIKTTMNIYADVQEATKQKSFQQLSGKLGLGG